MSRRESKSRTRSRTRTGSRTRTRSRSKSRQPEDTMFRTPLISATDRSQLKVANIRRVFSETYQAFRRGLWPEENELSERWVRWVGQIKNNEMSGFLPDSYYYEFLRYFMFKLKELKSEFGVDFLSQLLTSLEESQITGIFPVPKNSGLYKYIVSLIDGDSHLKNMFEYPDIKISNTQILVLLNRDDRRRSGSGIRRRTRRRRS